MNSNCSTCKPGVPCERCKTNKVWCNKCKRPFTSGVTCSVPGNYIDICVNCAHYVESVYDHPSYSGNPPALGKWNRENKERVKTLEDEVKTLKMEAQILSNLLKAYGKDKVDEVRGYNQTPSTLVAPFADSKSPFPPAPLVNPTPLAPLAPLVNPTPLAPPAPLVGSTPLAPPAPLVNPTPTGQPWNPSTPWNSTVPWTSDPFNFCDTGTDKKFNQS